MNEINSSKRLKFAVAERAEGEKILEVKRAEVRHALSYFEEYTSKTNRSILVAYVSSQLFLFLFFD